MVGYLAREEEDTIVEVIESKPKDVAPYRVLNGQIVPNIAAESVVVTKWASGRQDVLVKVPRLELNKNEIKKA